MTLVIKVWDLTQEKKLLILIKDFDSSDDIENKVKTKFNLSTNDSIRLVVEEDGSEVECSFEMMQAIGSSLIYTLLVNGEIWTKRLPQQCTPATVQEATSSSIGIGCLTSSSTGIMCSTSSSIGIGSSESDNVNPFISMQTFKHYLLKHPVTTDYVKSILETVVFTILARQAITRLVVRKMINVFGNYPTRRHKEDVASLLGQLFSMEAIIFFDPSTYSGFLQRGTENARRDWDDNRKVYNWKKRPLNCDKATPTKYKKSELKSLTFAENRETCVSSQTAASSDGCPRKLTDCVVCKVLVRMKLRSVWKKPFALDNFG
ncbi:uncharacterized protein LOC124817770 [Hydra vulgaris]|uniref:uncharacterized protein LOC124817770 n=1 Tax=Hydra vulgaris TaxID=6087 RepID=UPI001F5FAD51|nr:uncharacterized protein LOC124817770 [Hydra vulgaris]